ncbi:MAG: hypothetical protein GW778_06760 [Alphaproteobacteria bacterium]|nr:hypothetical protein [Alphaproteobacteria bacterium]
MNIATKLKIGSLGLFTSIVLLLWFFGGILGAITGIIKGEALFAVASLIIPAFGALYTAISAIGALLGLIF